MSTSETTPKDGHGKLLQALNAGIEEGMKQTETNAEIAARKLAEHTEDTAAAIAKATNRPTPKKEQKVSTTTKPKPAAKAKPKTTPKAAPKAVKADDGKVAFNLSTSAFAVLMQTEFTKAHPKAKAALLDADKRRSAGGAKFPGYHHPRMSREDAAAAGNYLKAEAARLEKLPAKERGGNLTSIQRYAGLVSAVAAAK